MSLSDAAMQRIIELTSTNKTRPEIAKEIGIHKTTVYRYQKKLQLL